MLPLEVPSYDDLNSQPQIQGEEDDDEIEYVPVTPAAPDTPNTGVSTSQVYNDDNDVFETTVDR